MTDTPEPSPPPKPPRFRLGLGHRLRNWFFAGIIVTAPIGLTVWLIWSFIAYVDRNVISLLPDRYHPETYLPFSVPGLGLVIGVVGLTLIGFLTTNILGRWLVRIGEKLVARMPIIRGLYGALKQLFETMLAQKATAFRQVALIEWPHAGMWTLAFVTTSETGEVGRRLGGDVVGLYVPTTPNPTGGYFVYLRRADLVILDMSVDEAMKHIISTGVVSVPDRRARALTPTLSPSKLGEREGPASAGG